MRRLCHFLQISCLLMGGLLVFGWPQSQLAARVPHFDESPPTDTFTPSVTFTPTWTPLPSSTPTWMPTPDCDNPHLSVRFVRFQAFGVVRLEVINSHNTAAVLSGFTIQWKKATSGSAIWLARVNAAAPEGIPPSTLLWQANSNQDTEPPTTSTDATEGTWLMDYSFSPNTTTPLFLDFDGTAETLDKKGIIPADFNGSQFNSNCDDEPHEIDTPVPTLTPTPWPSGTLTITPTRTPTRLPSMTPSKTVTNTPTWTPQPSITPTWTPELFRCDRVTAALPQISDNRVTIDINNTNQAATYITDVRFQWSQLASYPNLHVSTMALNGVTLWQGQDLHPPTNTGSTDPEDQSQPPFAETSIAARTLGGQTTARWGTIFSDGPAYLADYTAIYDYVGTYFTLYNPADPANPCLIPIQLPTITPTSNPFEVTPTPTATPDCDPSHLAVEFDGFENYGLVRLNIVNTRSAYTYTQLQGFTVNWMQSPTATLNLARVHVKAAPGMTGSVPVWQAASGQDTQPPTTSTNAVEGSWLGDYGVRYQSVTPLYLDFDGITAALDEQGITALDFIGTRFTFSCHGQIQEVVLTYPEQPATATFTPTTRPPTQTPTPLPTFDGPTVTPPPTCDSDHISAQLVGFEPYGLVRLQIKNNSNQLLGLFDFTVEWQQPESGSINLARVNGTASQGLPNSVLLWEAQSGQDSEPPTTGSNTLEGTWRQNYVISPETTVPLYLDFDGTTGTLDQLGLTLADFSPTSFKLFCGMQFMELEVYNPLNPPVPTKPAASLTPSMTATWTRVPTQTPTRVWPTYTPSVTKTPTWTPTKTPTRLPTLTPSQTFTPSRTPTRIPTITPTFRPTQEPNAIPTLNYYTGDVVLTWGRIPWAAQYYVQLDTDTKFNVPYTSYYSPNANTLEWRLPKLPPGVYFWRVRAVDVWSRHGDWSLIGSFVVGP